MRSKALSPRPKRAAPASPSPLPGDEHLADVEAVARMGSWRIDLATGVVTISPELRRILGWPPEAEFDAGRIGEIVHPDDQAKVRKWLALSAAGTPPKGGRFFRVVGANGRLRTLFGRSALRPEGRAAPDHVCGTIQDVTEQVANESAMTDVAPLYGDIFEHCAWGIFQTTAEGRYLAANPALARIFGYDSPEELMSKVTDISRQLYVDPKRRDEFVRAITENGVVRGFESEIYQRDLPRAAREHGPAPLLRGHRRRRLRAEAERGRAARGQGGGRGRRSGQDRIPRDDEPRAAHADKSRHRLRRSDQEKDPWPLRRARLSNLCRRYPPQRAASPGAHQRHPGFRQGRAWQPPAPAAGGRAFRHRHRRAPPPRAAGAERRRDPGERGA